MSCDRHWEIQCSIICGTSFGCQRQGLIFAKYLLVFLLELFRARWRDRVVHALREQINLLTAFLSSNG